MLVCESNKYSLPPCTTLPHQNEKKCNSQLIQLGLFDPFPMQTYPAECSAEQPIMSWKDKALSFKQHFLCEQKVCGSMIHIISPASSQWNIKIHQHAAYARCASSNDQSFLHRMIDVVITLSWFSTLI